MNKRILVAMSGGVDSSVAAALLVKQGFDVEGVTLKLTAGLCCDIGAAQSVCQHLGIPYRLIDARAEFSHNIIGDFISEYRGGRTPNPCIKCNDLVKFQILLRHALSLGFGSLATGHYARIEKDPQSSRYLLKRGVDEGKDQCYFLYRLTQDQMQSILFPLGGLYKADVRALARNLGLPTADQPESQEICFVPDNDYRAFLRENAPETVKVGDIVLTDGTVIGKHNGIAFFTLGQRRHLGVAAGERLYVIRIEPDANRIVLGRLSDLETIEMTVTNPNFILFDELKTETKVTVKIRYRSPMVTATIWPTSPRAIHVRFDKAVKGVCPGQAAVFYKGDTVVGGGIIG